MARDYQTDYEMGLAEGRRLAERRGRGDAVGNMLAWLVLLMVVGFALVLMGPEVLARVSGWASGAPVEQQAEIAPARVQAAPAAPQPAPVVIVQQREPDGSSQTFVSPPQPAPAAPAVVETGGSGSGAVEAAPAAQSAPAAAPRVEVVRINVQANAQEGSAPVVTGSGACRTGKLANSRCVKP